MQIILERTSHLIAFSFHRKPNKRSILNGLYLIYLIHTLQTNPAHRPPFSISLLESWFWMGQNLFQKFQKSNWPVLAHWHLAFWQYFLSHASLRAHGGILNAALSYQLFCGFAWKNMGLSCCLLESHILSCHHTTIYERNCKCTKATRLWMKHGAQQLLHGSAWISLV